MDKIVKCPNCKSKDLTLIELWKDHGIVWDQTKDGLVDREGILEMGDPYKVKAECKKCRHTWTIRGALQITNIYPSLMDREGQRND